MSKQEAERNQRINIDVFEQQNKISQNLVEQTNRRMDMERERAERAETHRNDENLKFENRLKRASSLMKDLLYPMPRASTEIASYLENVDKLFEQNHIDEDLRVTLLTPHLTDTVRRALINIPSDDVDTYVKWQACVLRENRVTPQMHKYNFEHCFRTNTESYTQYSTRLLCLFKSYLKSRNVLTYEDLVALMVSDRLKQCLKPDMRFFIADKEGNNWLKPAEIARLADLYEVEHNTRFMQFENYDKQQYYKAYNYGYEKSHYGSSSSKDQSYNTANVKKFSPGDQSKMTKPFQKADRSRVRCFLCGQVGHYQASMSSR